jgi:hypothetical protein
MPFWDIPKNIFSLEETERIGICLHFTSPAGNPHHCSQSRCRFPARLDFLQNGLFRKHKQCAYPIARFMCTKQDVSGTAVAYI